LTSDKSNITSIYIGLRNWSEEELLTRGIMHTYYSGGDMNENIVDLLLWILEGKLKDENRNQEDTV
jgi:hypothetical protein